MPITPFQIAIPEERIIHLKQKLALSDFPGDEPEAAALWSRGSPLSDIKRLSLHWENGFDWRRVEAELNKFPQYIALIEVEGFGSLDIHFVHQLSSPNSIPLLFLHGWPGSFIEVTKILPHLIRGENDCPTFHIVAPSLVGFGFSSGSKVNIQIKVFQLS